MDIILIAKLAGAVFALVLGLWIGLGTPGVKHKREPKDWETSERLRATWINRMFFRMERPSRGFDSGRLIAPKEAAGGEEADGGDERDPVVRLRRPRGG